MRSSPSQWLKTGASALRHPGRVRALFQDAAFRLKRKLTRRYSDVHLRQLRSLERAYSRADGPQLLVFGDSAMFWTTPTDQDHRHLIEMVRDELGGVKVEALVGPGYHARIVMAFLSALETLRSLPKVIIVPISTLMAQTIWLSHPELGYEAVAAELRGVIASGDRPQRLSKAHPTRRRSSSGSVYLLRACLEPGGQLASCA